jgi:hypothetical protein
MKMQRKWLAHLLSDMEEGKKKSLLKTTSNNYKTKNQNLRSLRYYKKQVFGLIFQKMATTRGFVHSPRQDSTIVPYPNPILRNIQ